MIILNFVYSYGVKPLITIFSFLKSCFSVKIMTVADEQRNSFEVLFTPFVNWLNKFNDFLVLLPVDSFKDSILRLYRLYLSFLMACFFFIMYVPSYTQIGLTIYRVLPILSICVMSTILAGVREAVDGTITDSVMDAVIAFRYLVSFFAIVPTSALIMALSAKSTFMRAILTDTIGFLSYKFYVGSAYRCTSGTPITQISPAGGGGVEKTGSNAFSLLVNALKLVLVSYGAAGGIAAIDHAAVSHSYEKLVESCRIGNVPLTDTQRLSFYKNNELLIIIAGKAVASILTASKQS